MMWFRRLLCATSGAALIISSGVMPAQSVAQHSMPELAPGDQTQYAKSKKMEKTTMQNTLQTQAKEVPLVEKYLLDGRLADGRAALEEQVAKHPDDDQAHFGLGALIFLQAIERLKQSLYHFGLRSLSQRLPGPMTRLQVAENPNPALFGYEDSRLMIDTFRQDLLAADHELSLIKDPDVKLPLHFGMIKLNFKGDGEISDGESLWNLYARVTNNENINIETAGNFYIKFDRGDVHWLRGYCHLIASFCEMYLAYDSRTLFEHTAHISFRRVDSPYKFLSKGKHVRNIGNDGFDITDLIAAVHLVNCKLVEPKRMEKALHHLETVVAQSRISWKFIMAETDNDHEWLPNPRQTGVIPNMQVTEEMVQSWAEIMNQTEKLLKGEELIPFWRGDEGLGVNLRKVFLQPSDFDLVLWVQGTAALPYLEKGRLSNGDTWRTARSTFGNRFPGFALYFN